MYVITENKVKKKIVLFAFGLILAVILALAVSAEEADSSLSEITSVGFSDPAAVTDGNRVSCSDSVSDVTVTVTRPDNIASVYVVFDRVPEEWTIIPVGGDEGVVCGTNGFLHELVDVPSLVGNTNSVILNFPAGTSVAEIYAFSEGDLPDFVQKWEKPLDRADLLLLSSHSDDEQLFFAGVLPLYAGERGLDVQVVYLVSHFNTHERPHEQLDGLWTVGVRNYPIISDFPDLYSESYDGAVEVFSQNGVEFEDFVGYITENIRRFKPLVVVSHDVNGEYGHGTHLICSAALSESLEAAKDSAKFPDSAQKYGVHTVEKAYYHLYPENGITLDLDTPLEHFGGKTAFEVTQDGFACHTSQHWTWFYEWIYGTPEAPITKATQIDRYSPCYYGLYYTTVGNDTVGGDFFENVKPYAEREAEAVQTEPVTETSPVTEPISPETAETAPAAEEEGGKKLDKTIIILLCVLAAVTLLAIFLAASAGSDKKRRRARRDSYRGYNGR